MVMFVTLVVLMLMGMGGDDVGDSDNDNGGYDNDGDADDDKNSWDVVVKVRRLDLYLDIWVNCMSEGPCWGW